MDINWKVRLKNRAWWLTFIPALMIAIQAIGAPFGMHFDTTVISTQIVVIINAVFSVLMLIGINVDMTTDGFSDSEQAKEYDKPKEA